MTPTITSSDHPVARKGSLTELRRMIGRQQP
jgi:hypothetical protein